MFGMFGREERLTTGEVLARLLQIISQQETSKFCKRCNKQVLARRPGTSRARHLLLTIVTLGLWSIIWIVDTIRRPGWRCSECDHQLK
jgi:hypothetical protein